MANAKRDGAAPEEVRDLGGAIEWMKKEGDIIVTDKEVDPNLEITGIQKQLDGGCPILFNNVKGKPQHRCITNLFGDMNVINKMFGWKDHADRTRKLAYAITHPIAPIVVDQKDAPVQEEVYEKPAEANDYVVPIRHTNIEPELTVGSGNRLISGEYFNGGTDLGYNRMNFRWGNVGTFQISPGSHMWQVVSKYYKDNKMVPITMNFGLPPAGSLLAGAGFDYVILPQGCDEVGMAGAVQGAPMRLVKARTVDAYALADAEVVLEGYVNPRDRRFETAESEKAGIQGRFHFHPEWAGYMGKAYKAPTFHVTAVTTRKREGKPIIFPARRAHARRSQHRYDDPRSGDVRALRKNAARHHHGRQHSLLHDGLGRRDHPGQETQSHRRRLAAQFHGGDPRDLAGLASWSSPSAKIPTLTTWMISCGISPPASIQKPISSTRCPAVAAKLLCPPSA